MAWAEPGLRTDCACVDVLPPRRGHRHSQGWVRRGEPRVTPISSMDKTLSPGNSAAWFVFCHTSGNNAEKWWFSEDEDKQQDQKSILSVSEVDWTQFHQTKNCPYLVYPTLNIIDVLQVKSAYHKNSNSHCNIKTGLLWVGEQTLVWGDLILIFVLITSKFIEIYFSAKYLWPIFAINKIYSGIYMSSAKRQY